jgi:hypothetical protein
MGFLKGACYFVEYQSLDFLFTQVKSLDKNVSKRPQVELPHKIYGFT